ncbi:MAG: MoxR family ATPase [Treponema phagedenis]|uniref:AAA family ATPase n=1 Tax=Treponema phagedenis TaxID=162 RepID=UPI003134067C
MEMQKPVEIIQRFKQEMKKTIIGQDALIEGILTAYIAKGHVLLEGVPGLAKTLIVKTFASIVGLDFKRIQFTPDLLPADLIGTLIFNQAQADFSVKKGPIFANIILADEINRAPAKVQSALLEAMAEGQVTIGEKTYILPEPFFVLATQNPIEQEGTYPLPEAELDRFFAKLFVPYPSFEEETKIITGFSDIVTNAESERQDTIKILSKEELGVLQTAAHAIHCDETLVEYIASIVAATRPITEKSDTVTKGSYLSYISFGASPRAGIALYKAAKIKALFSERDYVTPQDIKDCAPAILRHRLKLSYEAIADNLSADDIILKLLSVVPQP